MDCRHRPMPTPNNPSVFAKGSDPIHYGLRLKKESHPHGSNLFQMAQKKEQKNAQVVHGSRTVLEASVPRASMLRLWT